MTKYCSDCDFLNTSKKKEGSIDGCLYECSKNKKFVGGNMEACDKFEKSWSRKYYENNELYDQGRRYSDKAKGSIAFIYILLVILVILAFVLSIF